MSDKLSRTWRSVLANAESAGGRLLPLPLFSARDERRDHRRVPVQLRAQILREGRTYPAGTRDLSVGGLSVTANVALANVHLHVGSLVEVQLELPHLERPALVVGHVRWSAENSFGLALSAGALPQISMFVGSVLEASSRLGGVLHSVQ